MIIFTRVVFVLLLVVVVSACAVYNAHTTDWESTPILDDVSNVDLYVEEMGAGQPVILIHGFAANTYTWRHLVPELAKTHKVYSLDLKGFGKSPKPSDSAYTIVDQARLVLKFIRKNNLNNISIVGHSFGGGVALVSTLMLTKEPFLTVNKLLLIDSVAFKQDIPLFIELLATPFLGSFLANTLPEKLQVRNVLEKAYYNDTLITSAIVNAYASPLKEQGAVAALLTTARSIIPADIDKISMEYNRINVPTKLIWGRYDEIVPLEIGKKLNQAIIGSKLEIIEDCGHIPQEECPDSAIPVILKFLNN